MRFPATAPILIRRAPASAAESPKLSLLGAAPRRRANFPGSWQTSNALALQASLCGSVTHRFHHFQLRGESDSGEFHKLYLRGCDSHPRNHFLL